MIKYDDTLVDLIGVWCKALPYPDVFRLAFVTPPPNINARAALLNTLMWWWDDHTHTEKEQIVTQAHQAKQKLTLTDDLYWYYEEILWLQLTRPTWKHF